jgi:hypothetical protein
MTTIPEVNSRRPQLYPENPDNDYHWVSWSGKTLARGLYSGKCRRHAIGNYRQ